MNLKPSIEFASESEVAQMQTDKFLQLIQYLAKNSPYYQTHFQKHGLSFDKITSLDDLRVIPPTTKDDLQTENWNFLCVPRSQIVEYTTTSGTMGKPVTIALTQNDVKRLAYNEAISFACADGTSQDVYQLMLTLDRQFMAGLAYYEGIRNLGAAIVRVGPGLPDLQWETIERIQPTTIVGVPSFILRLAEIGVQQGFEINKSSVKKAVCIGENIRTNDLQKNSIARRINALWDIQLYGTYASTEMQTAFTECSAGAGGHYHPELLVLELLDEENTPVKKGEIGEVTVTTLGVEGMPLLRYKTGDMAIAFSDKCSCGRTSLRLGPILGRKQQLLKFKGTTVYPPAIMDILNHSSLVNDFAIEAYSNDVGNDEIILYVVADAAVQLQAHKELTSRLQSKLRVLPQVKFVPQSDLDKKIAASPANRKIKRFIDSRNA